MNNPSALHYAFLTGGFTTSSTFARQHAIMVAAMASMGLLTTLQPNGHYGNKWRLTASGADRVAQGHYYS
jgi:hypothetical protein